MFILRKPGGGSNLRGGDTFRSGVTTGDGGKRRPANRIGEFVLPADLGDRLRRRANSKRAAMLLAELELAEDEE